MSDVIIGRKISASLLNFDYYPSIDTVSGLINPTELFDANVRCEVDNIVNNNVAGVDHVTSFGPPSAGLGSVIGGQGHVEVSWRREEDHEGFDASEPVGSASCTPLDIHCAYNSPAVDL